MSKELAADYFSRHNSKECYITSDGRVFHDIGSAQSFASSLEDQTITEHKKPVEAIEVNDAKVVNDFTTEDLKAFDANLTSYNDALALAKSLNLELGSNKKDDVFAALEAEKAKIQE